MKKQIFENIRSIFMKALNGAAGLINQNLSEDEKKKIPKTSVNPGNFVMKNQNEPPHPEKKQSKKEIYAHKGSSYKGKGNVNTDAAVFNHPRKDVPGGKGKNK